MQCYTEKSVHAKNSMDSSEVQSGFWEKQLNNAVFDFWHLS